MNTAREFLRLLTDQLPLPRGRQHHSLIRRDDDSTGLDLVVWIGDEWQAFHLDREDLEKGPYELAGEVLDMIRDRGGGAAHILQFGEVMIFKCPNCGAVPHKHGKGECRVSAHSGCDGFICECYDEDEKSAQADHGTSFTNPCTTATCCHCGWSGAVPQKPKGLQIWEKKALEAGWQMPGKRRKELGL